MSNVPPHNTEKLYYIQTLRALAATLVVIAHLAKEVMHYDVSDPLGILTFLLSWQFGVDIFFVISGFIMYQVTVGKDDGVSAAVTFMKKRLLRIVPLYWFYTTLFLASLIFLPGAIYKSDFDIPYVIASYLFVPWARPGIEYITPLLGLGWTLNYEMLFYLTFASLMAVRVRKIFLVLAVLFGAATLVGTLLSSDATPQLWYWTRSAILEFVYGVGIAQIFHRNRWHLSATAGIFIVVLGLVIWQASYFFVPFSEPTFSLRGITWGLAAALIVLGISLTPKIVKYLEWGGPTGILQRIGNSSYSLYLAHMFVVRVMTITMGWLISDHTWPVYILVSTLACIAVAMMSYKFLEKPLIKIGRPRRKVGG